jgi:hypothetical protein
MDEINSKIIMLDEKHKYIHESYKMDEIFGWTWCMNELLDDYGNKQIVWMKFPTS